MATNEQKIANLRARTLQTIVTLQFEPIYGENWWDKVLLPHMQEEAKEETINGKKYRVALRKSENLSIDDLDTTVLTTILLYDDAFKGDRGGITAYTNEYDLLLKISNLRNAANHDETGHESQYAEQSLKLLKDAIPLFKLNVWTPDLANEIETFTFDDDFSSNNLLSAIKEQERIQEQKALGPFAERYNQACLAIQDGDYSKAESILIKLAEAHILPACKKLAGMYLRIPEFCDLAKAYKALSVLPEQERTAEGFYYLENILEKEKAADAGDVSSCLDLYHEYIEGDFVYSPSRGQHYLLIAAEKGDVNAMVRIALVDRKNSNMWLVRAAEMGNIDAMITLGSVSFLTIASSSISSEERANCCREAIKWYEKADALGSTLAARNLGAIYTLPECYDKDKAVMYLQKAADRGDSMAMWHLTSLVGNTETAFFWCQKAAIAGEAKSMNFLSRMFYYGIGCEKDFDQALYWAKAAVEAKCVTAFSWLGSLYYTGSGCDKDKELARDYFYKGALAGDCESMYLLAESDFKKDPQSAFKWFEKAAEAGHAMALTELGICYHAGYGCTIDYDAAFECWSEAVKQPKSEKAMYNLAMCYELGHGCARDLNAAFYRYNLAAKVYPPAMNEVGRCYERGIGCNKNLDAAFASYKNAAEHANLGGMNNLRRCYRDGIGCERNENAWLEWTQKAAEAGDIESIKYFARGTQGADLKKWTFRLVEAGDAPSMVALGMGYLYGDKDWDIKVDTDAAFKLFTKAKELGNVAALFYLAQCYLDGLGCTRDREKAFELLSKYISSDDLSPQAETRRPAALDLMGDYLWYGLGCTPDASQAFTFYQQAAELNNIFSIYHLGVCYASGEGCEFDAKKAAILFKKAAEAGRIEAMEGLAWCYFNYGTKVDVNKAYYWYGKAAESGNQAALEWIAEHPEAKRYYDTHKESPEIRASRSTLGKLIWGPDEKSLTDE